MELPELLIKLYDTQVPCVAVGRNTNTNWRCPDDAANDIVLQLAPPLLYIHKDSLQYIDLGNCVGQLVLSFYKLRYYRSWWQDKLWVGSDSSMVLQPATLLIKESSGIWFVVLKPTVNVGDVLTCKLEGIHLRLCNITRVMSPAYNPHHK